MSKNKITSTSIAKYFSENLQQVGFSSPLKATLTTLKEAVDNALDACEEAGILPELEIKVEKLGVGSSKNSDLLLLSVQDNGPGIPDEYLPSVFGEYLASSKFGRGKCTRGQQGIGISAATTWAQMTTNQGALVTTKLEDRENATQVTVDVDFRQNKGVLRDKKEVTFPHKHGTRVEFKLDGKLQSNGEAGLVNYIMGTALMNPHAKISFQVNNDEKMEFDRVSNDCPVVPESTEPHPHTMKLGELSSFVRHFEDKDLGFVLRTKFSRITHNALSEESYLPEDFDREKFKKFQSILKQKISDLSNDDLSLAYNVISNLKLMGPSTKSVISVGEKAISKSVERLGVVDFFSVVSRNPTVCDFKPVQVEVAVARLENGVDGDESVQVLRFANRVPLQFDKSACAIVKAIESVNWKSYGMEQSKDSLPRGNYIFAVSITSPFLKFKNASKETIDASDELVQEIRLALIQCGQKLSKFIRKEDKDKETELNSQYIEQFAPVLIEYLARIAGASDAQKKRASTGLQKILGRKTS